jgi:hypothetical protein
MNQSTKCLSGCDERADFQQISNTIEVFLQIVHKRYQT